VLAAAWLAGVPKSTLWDHVRASRHLRLGAGAPPLLSTEEEERLVDRIVAWSHCGFSLSAEQVRELAHMWFGPVIASRGHRFEASKRWLRAFMRRHHEQLS
jgi:hypothetical protein